MDNIIRLEITLKNDLDSNEKNQRIQELELELEKVKAENKRLQYVDNQYALMRLRLSRAIKAIKRLGGDPSIFGL